MTYFDADALEQSLREVIHIPPRPAAKTMERFLKTRKVKAPGAVLAVHHGDRPPRFRFAEKHPQNAYVYLLRVHPRLTYVSFAGKSDGILKEVDAGGLTHGEPWAFDSADRWIWAIQNAIVSMRDRELVQLGRHADENFSQSDENLARAKAIEALRTGRPEWREAARYWMGVVLVRYRRHLHSVRRRMVELLTQLTRDVEGTGISNPFRLCMGRVYDTFAYTDLYHLMEELLAHVAPFVSLSAGDPQLAPRRRSPPVERALAYMRERFADAISLDDVALAVHVSAAHLCRLFRSETGKTVTDYLQGLRVYHARSRLAETNDELRAVAMDSGFRSVEHFFRVFKKHAGETPRAYRLAHRS
jgi:AraC-like DNA-binding protein